MPKYQILITKRARKDIDKLSKPLQKRVYKKLKWFIGQKDPLAFAEPLTKPADGDYRWRIGEYRVVFAKTNNKLYILHIQHRREVYRNK